MNRTWRQERLAAKELERLKRKEARAEEQAEAAASAARSEAAKADFMQKKRDEQERSRQIQAALAARSAEPEPEPEPEPEVVIEEWVPPPEEEVVVKVAGIKGRFPEQVAALEAARSHQDNLVAAVFEAEMLDQMGPQKAEALLEAVRLGYEQPEVECGCFLKAAEDYRRLQPFLDRLIRRHFKLEDGEAGKSGPPLHIGPDTAVRGGVGPSWECAEPFPLGKTAGKDAGCVVRFDRNLKDTPLLAGMGADEEPRIALEERLVDALAGAFEMPGRYYSLTVGRADFASASDVETLRAVADGMMLPDLSDAAYDARAELWSQGGVSGAWPQGRGVWLAEDRSVSVWVGAREHVTVLAAGRANEASGGMAGLLETGRVLLEKLLAALGGGAAWATHVDYGFVRASAPLAASIAWQMRADDLDAVCLQVSTHPSNLGTGMRFTARIALPTLSKRGKDLGALSRAAASAGLAVGGVGGEVLASMDKLARDGKCVVWCEAPAFGVTEGQAVAALAQGVGQLLAAEEKAKAVARGAAKFYS